MPRELGNGGFGKARDPACAVAYLGARKGGKRKNKFGGACGNEPRYRKVWGTVGVKRETAHEVRGKKGAGSEDISTRRGKGTQNWRGESERGRGGTNWAR